MEPVRDPWESGDADWFAQVMAVVPVVLATPGRRSRDVLAVELTGASFAELMATAFGLAAWPTAAERHPEAVTAIEHARTAARERRAGYANAAGRAAPPIQPDDS